jgi:GT2 family glycosyltransferase
MKSKYSIGLLTHNNVPRFRECISYIPYNKRVPFVVINDGNPYDISEYRDDMTVIQHPVNRKISRSKNDAIQYLLSFNTEWIFLMENDMRLIDPKVFERYIEVANDSGLLHLNYDLHGNDNWNEGRINPKPRLVYGDRGIALYSYAGGCFQLFHRSLFEKIGYFDEYYQNCWEHLDLTFRITLSGYHTPYWLSADVIDSHNLIKQIDYNIESTVSTESINDYYRKGLDYWKDKFGMWVGDIPDWVNPEHHTDIIMEMLKEKRYDELSVIYHNFYNRDGGKFFNP